MDSKQTTALVPFEESAPTIEFTLPAGNEAYTSAPETEDTQAEESAWQQRIPLPLILRKITAGFLIGITVITAAICTGHAAARYSFSRDDIPAFLLAVLSAGEVHAVSIAETQEATAASRPDHPLNSVQAPEIPRKEPELQPQQLTFTNETPYAPDPDVILSRERAIPPLEELHTIYGEAAPTVLILSTHGTEAYTEHSDSGYRTSDDSENTVRIASVIAQTLEKAGIGVIHSRTKFDEEDFTLAYYNASLEIRSQLRENPSIRYVIDVHRDSVQNTDGAYLAMETDGMAQLMFVVGTDHGGSGHIGWEDNLALAARLHTAIETQHPGIMRAVNIRSASFNQQYTSGSLILEVGSCAGSLENALKSAGLFAEAFAGEIIG